MPVRHNVIVSLLVPVFCAVPLSIASAISVDVAKKCEALLDKQFPPRQIGNPASGSAKGSAKDRHDYFQKCVTNGGKMDDAGQTQSK